VSEAALAAAAAAIDDEHDPIPFSDEELAEARRYSMLVQWSPEDDAWIVTVPELGDAKTHGVSPAEAVAMGADLVATYLDFCRRRGEPVPAPRLFGG
jgi:predicted RNase H-like HicB family nuclease